MRGNAARASLATAQGDTSFSSRFAAREEQNKSTLAAGGREKQTATGRSARRFREVFSPTVRRLARITRRFRGLERAFVPFPRRDEKSFENPEKSQSIFFGLVS